MMGKKSLLGSRNLLGEILQRDIVFLEAVVKEAVSLAQGRETAPMPKRIKMALQVAAKLAAALQKELQEEGANGYGVKITDPYIKEPGMACYELALYGYSNPKGSLSSSMIGTQDPREFPDLKISSQSDAMVELGKYYGEHPELARATIFDPEMAKRGIAVAGLSCGIVGYTKPKDVSLAEEKRPSTPIPFMRQTRRKSQGEQERILAQEGYLIEHFALILPSGCLIETVPGRSIMCTDPSYPMEGVLPQDKKLSERLPINHITPQQLEIIDSLVKEALRLKKVHELEAIVPIITRSYDMLRDMVWLDEDISELNCFDLETMKLIDVCEKLLEEYNDGTQDLLLQIESSEIQEQLKIEGISNEEIQMLLDASQGKFKKGHASSLEVKAEDLPRPPDPDLGGGPNSGSSSSRDSSGTHLDSNTQGGGDEQSPLPPPLSPITDNEAPPKEKEVEKAEKEVAYQQEERIAEKRQPVSETQEQELESSRRPSMGL